MKTTIDLDDKLLLAAKQCALDGGTTLRQVIEAALTQWLRPVQQVQVPIRTLVYASALKESATPSAAQLGKAAYDFDARVSRRLGLD